MLHLLRPRILYTRNMRKPNKRSSLVEIPPKADWERLAVDPATDSQVLAHLCALSEEPPVLRALARNPATPKIELMRLWRNDPGAILENAVVVLWEFSKPGSTSRMISRDVQFRLYQHLLSQEVFESKPEWIDPERIAYFLERPEQECFRLPLHSLVRDKNKIIRVALLDSCIKKAAASQGGPVPFPHEALESLAMDSSRDVAESFASAIAENCLRPEPMDSVFLIRLAEILLLKNKGSLSIAFQVAKWPCLNSNLIEKLARRADENMLAILAAHPQASENFQDRMACHHSEIVRSGVAASTRSETLMRKLVKDPDPFVRAKLATSPHLPSDLQRVLYERKDPRILQGLLQNQSTSGELLEAMARLPFLFIEKYIRTHPNTPPHVLERYSESPLTVNVGTA